MAHALLGETGTIYADDIRGRPVLAAFTPVGDTGLGFVVKIETVEFYAFIRQKLHILAAILALLVISGIYILRFQLQPLVSRLVQSEQKTRRSNAILAEALNEIEQTAESLRASDERTRIIIESAYDAFVEMDSHGCITDWNRQAEKIFGWSHEQCIGKFLTELIVTPGSRAAFEERLALVIGTTYRAEDNQRLEISVNHYTGNPFIVEMTMSPVRAGGNIRLAAFMHDITERKQHQEKLTQLAQYDVLTGLPNRSLFMDRLSVAILRVERAKRTMALLFLDLDGFKKINDHFGHQAGDVMLKTFAQRLTDIVRKTDTVARLGGDEFTIILENLANPERDTQMIANKIVKSMAEPFIIAGESLKVTTSIGIVIMQTGHQNIDELIKSADAQMYKAKNNGKNQFSVLTI
jgi:diguanylate cyclase (GGDEF)-like protein/PAS domain S-box-containing protein